MNFQQFASKNVLRNIEAYFAYFLSSMISAAMFFSFTMFMFHPNLRKEQIGGAVKVSIFIIEIIAYLILLLFVLYSVSVFLKSRYNEFGILFITGMSKIQLNKLIFIENLIISSISVFSGIILGLVFSKFFLLFTSKLLRINKLTFYFPIKAILITSIAFLLLFVTISFFTSFIIKENEVLKLIKGTKKPKMEPKFYKILVVLCIVFFIVGYFKAVNVTEENLDSSIIPVTIIIIIATYLFFSQFTVFLIKSLKYNKRIYNKNINVIWISNLFYRIKDNSRMFFIVTIASAVAFTSIGSIYTYYTNMKVQTKIRYPEEIFYLSAESNKNQKYIVDTIESSLKNSNINYNRILGQISLYKDLNGSNLKLIKESDYNMMASNLRLKKLSLQENQCLKVPGISYTVKYREKVDISESININGVNLKILGLGEKNIFPSGYYTNVYVIKDEFWNKIQDNNIKENYYTYKIDNWDKLVEVSNEIKEKIKYIDDETRIICSVEIYEYNKQDAGLLVFLALFIGVIFLFTTGSFLYNKFYIDALEDKKKYKNMSKIGVTYNEIRKVVTIELGILFLTPYIVATIHAVFALNALKSAMDMYISKSLFLIMGSFFIIQIVYFLIIKSRYLREVKKEIY